jgi:hypothetical protein
MSTKIDQAKVSALFGPGFATTVASLGAKLVVLKSGTAKYRDPGNFVYNDFRMALAMAEAVKEGIDEIMASVSKNKPMPRFFESQHAKVMGEWFKQSIAVAALYAEKFKYMTHGKFGSAYDLLHKFNESNLQASKLRQRIALFQVELETAQSDVRWAYVHKAVKNTFALFNASAQILGRTVSAPATLVMTAGTLAIDYAMGDKPDVIDMAKSEAEGKIPDVFEFFLTSFKKTIDHADKAKVALTKGLAAFGVLELGDVSHIQAAKTEAKYWEDKINGLSEDMKIYLAHAAKLKPEALRLEADLEMRYLKTKDLNKNIAAAGMSLSDHGYRNGLHFDKAFANNPPYYEKYVVLYQRPR